ncbi:MAG: hypothetical protein AMXMBFR57_15130 [Acidimicrobiia bacterium]|jgi:hypothetical protein
MVNHRRGRDRRARHTLEGIAAVGVCYFVLGGSDWTPAMWALFATVAIGVVVNRVHTDIESSL